MAAYPNRGLHATVVTGLAHDIIGGKVPPGATLDLDELGARFAVSRTVVREALKVLAAKGLVDARPKRGTFVQPRDSWNLLDPDVLRWQFEGPEGPTPVMLDNLAQVRLIFEPAAASLAAVHRTEEDLAAIAEALARMEESDRDVEAITLNDCAFHQAILKACGNDLLAELAMVIEIGLTARNRFVHRHDVAIGPSMSAHGAVLEAIRARDPEAAERLMRDLLVDAARDVDRLRSTDDERHPILSSG